MVLKIKAFVFCFLILYGLICALTANAQQELSKEQAESRLQSLKVEIEALQRSLEQSRKSFSKEQAELKAVDLDIQAGILRLRELNSQQAKHQADLSKLEAERHAYLDSLKETKTMLSEQIVSAYQLGRESRLKLLLNQDSPARLSRMLAYYDFFNQAQIRQIEELRIALTTLDQMQADIDGKLLQLASIQESHQKEVASLEAQRDQRLSVVGGLAGRISSDEAKLDELSRNRSDLQSLIERLSGALVDIPSELGQYTNPAEMRGSIPVPVKGKVIRAFGQTRLGGLNWQGWLIQASRGSEVNAIAYGRVAYADWLRGYGLLMIIDHGDGIMSLYGHNESLLYDVGDWVQPGSVISTVGENPGNDQGLYFELRNQGKAVDPATWLAR